MSMEVSNSYGNYYTGMLVDTRKKNDSISGDTKGKNVGNKDNVQEYYEKLCKRFSQISFNTNGGEMSCGSNKVAVNLSYDCLKKMANDSEFAKKIEWNLSGEVAANSLVYGNARRDGVELGGRTVTYDSNGNRQSSCGGMRTANTGNSNNKIKDQNEYRDKVKKQLEEKRAAKKAEEKKAAKKRMSVMLTQIQKKGVELYE